MKMSIAWHKQCLSNQMKLNASRQAKIEGLIAAQQRQTADAERYAKQIALAVEQKRDGFDSDLFAKKLLGGKP